MKNFHYLLVIAIAFFAGVVSASVLGDAPTKNKILSNFDQAHEQEQAY